MSPSDTRQMGDLRELPDCAPEGLKSLFALGEGVIQKQIRCLGDGKPSQAPDLGSLLRTEGIEQPDNQSVMLDHYIDHEDTVEAFQEEYVARDAGISVTTAGIGETVTNAYDAIDESVDSLNRQIEDAEDLKVPARNEDGTPLLDDQGNQQYRLPTAVTAGLFSGLWDTLGKTYEQVSGVSDQAAEEALGIEDSTRTYTDSPYGGNGTPPMSSPTPSYPTFGPSGTSGAVVTPTSGSMGTAIVPSTDKPEAMEMMRYLIEEHGFTPAQAAGIVANARYESHFDVGATGDNGTAHGLFQWRFDRYAGLQEFASRPGEDIGDWKTHIDYMVDELRNAGPNGESYQKAEDMVDGNPNDARAVAEAFDRHYERSSGHTIDDRREYAAGVLDEWNKTNQSSSSIAV